MQIMIRNLHKSFKVYERPDGKWGLLKGAFMRNVRYLQALDGISFDIGEGELVGYIGPNGAGKSTTVKVMSGILTPDSGDCEIMGRTPWKNRIEHVSGIGVVFGQRSQLWWDVPVKDSFDVLRDIYAVSASDYKGWWLMLLNVFIGVISDPISTVLLFSRFGSIGEWTVERIILIYALAVSAFGLAECFFRGFDYFPWQMIRTGNFDRLLLRPRSLFTQVAASIFHLHRIVRPITGVCAAVWALRKMNIPFSGGNIAILISALAGGCIMYCGVFVLTSGLAFFTIKGLDWIYILTNASYQITRCPEPYMPKFLKNMFSFLLPVLFISFYPSSAICGWGYPTWAGYIALPAGLLFLGVSLIVWKTGVSHYKSTGS